MASKVRWSFQRTADWIQTEGTPGIEIRKRRAVPFVEITQVDRRPLELIKDFLATKGIKSPVRKRSPFDHRLRIENRRNVSKLYQHTKRYYVLPKIIERWKRLEPLLIPGHPLGLPPFPFDPKRKKRR